MTDRENKRPRQSCDCINCRNRDGANPFTPVSHLVYHFNVRGGLRIVRYRDPSTGSLVLVEIRFVNNEEATVNTIWFRLDGNERRIDGLEARTLLFEMETRFRQETPGLGPP